MEAHDSDSGYRMAGSQSIGSFAFNIYFYLRGTTAKYPESSGASQVECLFEAECC